MKKIYLLFLSFSFLAGHTAWSQACLPITITPSSATVCAGTVQQLTATHSNPSNVPGSSVNSSGAINLPINDFSTISNTVTVAGIPAGSIVSSVVVNFNIIHTYDSDLTISLKAPNGNVINLVNARGGAGDNFTNTNISSASTVSLATGTAPFTGTFMADASTNQPPAGFMQTTTTFSSL